MPSPSKVKGNKFERDCVNKAKEFELKAVRAWGSDGRSLGLKEDVDMILEGFHAQCKIRKRLAKWVLPPESCDIAIVREDRGETYVTINYVDFLSMLRTVSIAKKLVEEDENE